jgi:hypothetical protein
MQRDMYGAFLIADFMLPESEFDPQNKPQLVTPTGKCSWNDYS